MDPITQCAAGKVPWILLPSGPANACGTVAWDAFVMVILETMTPCIEQRINTWDVTLRGKLYYNFFQHLGPITLGCFITFTFCIRTSCSCIQFIHKKQIIIVR
jgi:hypothetical protein